MELHVPFRPPSRLKIWKYRLARAGLSIWTVIAIGVAGFLVAGLAVYSIVDATSRGGWLGFDKDPVEASSVR